MQITRSSIETLAGPSDWFTGDGARGRRRGAIGPVAPVGRLRPLHSGRAHRVAHAPQRPDDLRHRGHRALPAPRRAVEVIRPGDRVFFEPGEEHWHGAAPNRFMTHLAMLDVDDEGNNATWGEHVTDEEYAAAPAT